MTRYLVKVGGMIVEKEWISIDCLTLHADEAKAKIYPALADASLVVGWLHDHGVTQAIVWRVTLTTEEAVMFDPPLVGPELANPASRSTEVDLIPPPLLSALMQVPPVVTGGEEVSPALEEYLSRRYEDDGVTEADTPIQ